MRTSVIFSLVVVAFVASAFAEPPAASYGVPSGAYGAPVASYGAPVVQEVVHEVQSGGWAQPVVSKGWGWEAPRKYLNLRIPIPRIPKIRLGIKAGISVQKGGWGWGKK